MERLAALVLVAMVGCTSSHSDDTAPYCVRHGDGYVCAGTTYPACQTDIGGCDPDASPPCMGCNLPPAGFYCTCQTATETTSKSLSPDGGPYWLCVGTEQSCQ